MIWPITDPSPVLKEYIDAQVSMINAICGLYGLDAFTLSDTHEGPKDASQTDSDGHKEEK